MRTIHRSGPFAKEFYPQFRKRIINAVNWLYDPSFPDRLAQEDPPIPTVLSVKPPILIPVIKAWNAVRLNPGLFEKDPDQISQVIKHAPEEFLYYLDQCFNHNLSIQPLGVPENV